MRRWQKIVAMAWTTALAAPILWIAWALGTSRCEDIDPCATGGPSPYSTVALSILVAVAVLQLAFLLMIRGIPDAGPTGDEAE